MMARFTTGSEGVTEENPPDVWHYSETASLLVAFVQGGLNGDSEMDKFTEIHVRNDVAPGRVFLKARSNRGGHWYQVDLHQTTAPEGTIIDIDKEN